MKTETLLASVTYRCKTEKGHSFRVTADLVDKFGFPYGSHHGIIIFEDGVRYYALDARYDRRFDSVEGFYNNILDVLKARHNIVESRLVDME